MAATLKGPKGNSSDHERVVTVSYPFKQLKKDVDDWFRGPHAVLMLTGLPSEAVQHEAQLKVLDSSLWEGLNWLPVQQEPQVGPVHTSASWFISQAMWQRTYRKHTVVLMLADCGRYTYPARGQGRCVHAGRAAGAAAHQAVGSRHAQGVGAAAPAVAAAVQGHAAAGRHWPVLALRQG